MNTLKKIYSAAVVCLLSLKKRKNLQRFLCIICILSLLIPGFSLTVTAITVLGFSAMAGLVGGGGIGDLAYRYGYQRYKKEVMIICILLLIILVQLVQTIGDLTVRALNKRGR